MVHDCAGARQSIPGNDLLLFSSKHSLYDGSDYLSDPVPVILMPTVPDGKSGMLWKEAESIENLGTSEMELRR